MLGIKLDYIKKTDILKKIEDLFGEFIGLDFDIFDVEDAPPYFPCSVKCKTKTVNSKAQSEDCNQIDKDILAEVISRKEKHIFECPARLTKVFLPLSINGGDLIGVLFIGENGSSAPNKTKLDSASVLLSHLVKYILENEVNTLAHFKTNHLTRQQQLVQKVVKYLETNHHSNGTSLKDAAHQNNIGYHYLSHLFKRELNTSFVQYRTQVKMRRATKLLKNFGLTVAEIAYECGFEDPSYFCKVFKTAYKCPPGDYRRRLSVNGRRNNHYA